MAAALAGPLLRRRGSLGVRIHGTIVSVDYADMLRQSIGRWAAGLASLTVITAARDEETIALTLHVGVTLHITDAFWLDGAYMNKGRALQEARRHLPQEDWHLFLDADVIPPEDWLARVTEQTPQAGVLHGAKRVSEAGTACPDRELAGFFHLFHSADPRAAAPLADNFYHAANYDSLFMMRWPRSEQRILDLTLVHIGEPGQNWCGRGNDAAMKELRRSRREGNHWRLETVKP
jgi:hypothetical protein